MSSPLIPAGGNWSSEAARLKQAGFTMPNSPVQARLEARRVAETVSRGSLTDIANRRMTADMNRRKASSGGSFVRTAADLQMALPKIRQPLSSLMDKGIPFNVNDPKELIELRRWCNSPQAPIWMADYTFKPIGEIKVGDRVIGWETHEYERTAGRKRKDGQSSIGKRRTLVKSTVLAVNRRMAPEVVRVTFASGRTAECTPDHEWLRYYTPGRDGRILNGPEASQTARYDSDYAPLQVGSVARSVIRPTDELHDLEKVRAASYLAGIIDGEGSWTKRTVRICQSEKHNPHIVERIDQSLELLGLTYSRYVRTRHDAGHRGGDMVIWDLCQPNGHRNPSDDVRHKNRQQIVDIYNWARPAKFDTEHMDQSLLSSNFGEPDRVVSVESLGPGEVVSMQTTTGNYTAWGFASKNCRLFYSTHDLVPLLIDIYAKFPVVGMEFQAKDPLIEKFYTDMFLNKLNYEEFLPDSIGREYFVAGEVTTLAHFNESLGVWSSEEVLNPDMVSVSKSLFIEEERVQLLVKDLVEALKTGPAGRPDAQERPSERLERGYEYQQLQKYYPEIIAAAARDDGLDIADALVSRLVNKASPWDLRGTPHLLRSFRTLLMEESLNAAQDAVADRLYAPMVLATMGLDNVGNDEPWIPSSAELDDLRDDLQSALAADFKLLVHNFGVKVESVFGRESVPRFDQDYDRIDAKLMQAWGIGQALIMGGTGAGGTYASSAINREVCEQLMMGFQKKVIRHMRKRMEVIAEAQEHFDYEVKGGLRIPLYREVVEEDPETGEQRIVRAPKLLIPDPIFATLNLRDENTERQFYMMLKQSGVPVSDKALAVNIQIDFEQELEREAEETFKKGLAKAQAFDKLQKVCDQQRLPYPPELAAHLEATLQLRELKAQTEMIESQAQMSSPEGQAAAAMAGAGGAPQDPNAAAGGAPPDDGSGGDPAMEGGDGSMAPQAYPPMSSGPSGVPMDDPTQMDAAMGAEPPRNRTRPEESDQMRAGAPRAASASARWAERVAGTQQSKIVSGPSSVGHARRLAESDVEAAVRRREVYARHSRSPMVSQLVEDPDFYRMTNSQGDESAIRADYPEIRAGSGKARESEQKLRELVSQYEYLTGVSPVWD